jgi:hypothetical protein
MPAGVATVWVLFRVRFSNDSEENEYVFRVILLTLISSAVLVVGAPQPQPFRRPLVFEPNRGQAPAQVKWRARGPGYQLFLTSEGTTMMVQEHAAEPAKGDKLPNAEAHQKSPPVLSEKRPIAQKPFVP